MNDNGSTSFTLHITNLPLDIEKDGVENIFLHYGKVTGCIVFRGRNNTNQAYISFSKYDEAEQAIKNLDQQLPLMLNVRFKNDHKIEKPVVDLSAPIVDFRYTNNIHDTSQVTKKVIDTGKINCTPALQPKNYTTEDELLYAVPNDTDTFNPYEPQGPYHNTNLMYTRGTTHISKDGRRHISFGRGYTYYHLPEAHHDIGMYIQNVYEKREKGLYEYAAEVEDDAGLCKICSAPTSFRCQKCSITFYCSRLCQVNDWAKHKLECHPVPPLVKRIPNKAPAQNGHAIESNVKDIETQGSTQLRRPKTASLQTQQQQQPLVSTQSQQTPSPSVISPNKDVKFSRDNFRPKLTSPVSAKQESNISVPKSSAPSMNNTDNRQKSYDNRNNLNKQSPTHNNFKAIATTFPTKQPQQQNIEPKAVDDNIGFQSHTFIPKDRFVKVRITWAMENEDYCVQKCDDDEAIEKLFLDLQSYANSSKRIPPEENVKCILENEGMWYRATIVSLDKISKIFYHDWGTYDHQPVNEVCPISGFKDRPLFCRRIRLAEGTDVSCKSLNVDDELSVKALNVLSDGTIIVQAQPITSVKTTEVTDKMANCSIKQTASALTPQKMPVPELSEFEKIVNKVKSMPNVIDHLEADVEGFLLLNKETEDEHSITLLPESQMEYFETLLSVMKNKCDKLAMENPNFKPNVGDLVCGLNEDGDWLRGIVLRTTPQIKLAAIDEARILNPTSCTPIPKEFIDICSMGIIGKFLPNTQMPDPKPADLEFIVDNVSRDSAMITLKHKELNVSGKAILSKWVLKPEEKGILYAPLGNGNEVVLTHVSSQNSLYIRNMESPEKERVLKLDQSIAKYALNPKPLTSTPVIGQIVLAHFILDENYYRAIVTAINDKKIMIKYIDYGNDEETNINKLFDLPEELKEQTSGIRKIKLKGVPENVPLTQEVKDYFDQLILEIATLKCHFIGDPLVDGVELKTEKNENVNDIVATYLKPTWERGVEDNKKVYTYADLPDPKLGDVGDEVVAIPLFSYPDNGSIIFGANDIVAANAIEDLGKIINNYVEKTPDHYIPRNKELCIAKYGDQFYRAICIDSNATPNESRVLFFDYGNIEIVAHTDIRIFTEDFTKLAPYGVICNISPMVPSNKLTDKIFQRIDELIKPKENEAINVKIISVDADFTANIDIPSIRVKLTEEGLL